MKDKDRTREDTPEVELNEQINFIISVCTKDDNEYKLI